MKALLEELLRDESVKRLCITLSNGNIIDLKQNGINCITGYDNYFIIDHKTYREFISYASIVKIKIPSNPA